MSHFSFTPEQAVEIIKKLAEAGEIKLIQPFAPRNEEEAKNYDFTDAAFFNGLYLKFLLSELTDDEDLDGYLDENGDLDPSLCPQKQGGKSEQEQ